MDRGVAANLATAAGTLALALGHPLLRALGEPFEPDRDRALQQGMRLILLPSLFTDAVQKVHHVDDHWLLVPGGRPTLEITPTAA